MRASQRAAGAAAMGAAAVLLLGGCGSSDDGGGKPVQDGAAETVKPPEEKKPDASGPASLHGVWNTRVDGEAQVLTVAGSRVSLLQDGKLCTGATAGEGKRALALKCPDGVGEERTAGAVAQLGSTSLKVRWNGGDTDTYTKVADAPEKLPADPEELEKLVPGK